MARDYFVNGEAMAAIKCRAGSAYANLTNLGLCADQIRITPTFHHEDVRLDAWGKMAPNEVQAFLAEVAISMSLIHYDRDVLRECVKESLGGASTEGTMKRAGTRMGNGVAFGEQTNHFIRLNIYSPVGQDPWRFYHCYLTQRPFEYPIGTEKSIVTLNWRCIPYSPDPWNNGSGAEGVVLYDRTLDT